jgi:hypothetical protein
MSNSSPPLLCHFIFHRNLKALPLTIMGTSMPQTEEARAMSSWKLLQVIALSSRASGML